MNEKKMNKAQRTALEVFKKLHEVHPEVVIAVLVTGLVTSPKIRYIFPIGKNWIQYKEWSRLGEKKRKEKIVYWGSFTYKGIEHAEPDINWAEMYNLTGIILEDMYYVSQKTIEHLFNEGFLEAGEVFSTPNGLCVEFKLKS